MITGELKNKIDLLWDIFAAPALMKIRKIIETINYNAVA